MVHVLLQGLPAANNDFLHCSKDQGDCCDGCRSYGQGGVKIYGERLRLAEQKKRHYVNYLYLKIITFHFAISDSHCMVNQLQISVLLVYM